MNLTARYRALLFYVLLPRLPALPNQAAVLDSLDGFGDFFHRQGQGQNGRSLHRTGQSWSRGCRSRRLFQSFPCRTPCWCRGPAGPVPRRTWSRGCPAHPSRWSGSPRTGVAAALVFGTLGLDGLQRACHSGNGGFLLRDELAEIDLGAQLLACGNHIAAAHQKLMRAPVTLKLLLREKNSTAQVSAPGMLKMLWPTAPSKMISL